jgi:hypothetical protein
MFAPAYVGRKRRAKPIKGLSFAHPLPVVIPGPTKGLSFAHSSPLSFPGPPKATENVSVRQSLSIEPPPSPLSSRAYPDFLPHRSHRRPLMWFSLKRTTCGWPKSQLSTGNPGEPRDLQFRGPLVETQNTISNKFVRFPLSLPGPFPVLYQGTASAGPLNHQTKRALAPAALLSL